ncbi:MAG TPA: serine hydrolase [Acidimicrobiales bacterium]|nr:serine hydrolase [Acidimicrobiales bacterium]
MRDLADLRARPLVPLPPQPDGVPWPTEAWPTADPDPAVAGPLAALLDDLTTDTERYGTTWAVAVVHRGRLVAERYGGLLEHWDRPFEPVEPTTLLMSWSMAKSMLHAVVGTLVGDGRLALDAPAPVPEWSDPTDPRHAITLEDLLTMRDGLAFSEDYGDTGSSDVIEMLFGEGKGNVARFAADRPLAHPPGTVFNYSSGTSNIVSGIVARLVGPGAPYERLLHDRLFRPLGMWSAEPAFDAAGTFVGSSEVRATARDYLRFGLLYLRDGVWEGRRLLPEGWVDHGRRIRSYDPPEDRWYGAHWWSVGDDLGTFWASGFEGQSIMLCPPLDLLTVRLGRSAGDDHTATLAEWRAAVVDAFRKV